MNLFRPFFTKTADNRFEGPRAALWLLGFLLFVKLAMSLNSILNTEKIAAGADGIPLASYGPEAARQILLLFALASLGHLVVTLVAFVVLVRYRALVPFIYLVLLTEQLARRAVARSHAVPGAQMTDVAFYLTYGILVLLVIGLALSLIRSKPRPELGRRQG